MPRSPAGARHLFLQPSLEDPFYHCGGWQITNRSRELASRVREAEIVTYRHREPPLRFLDDIPPEELAESFVWMSWSAHLAELAERLPETARPVFYAMNTDYGRDGGQVTPRRWPLVALSHYIAADYSLADPARLVLHLPPSLHPGARNPGGERPIEVLCHLRKNVAYVRERLIPALEERLRVEVIRDWIPQEEFLERLGRSRVYLYWVHRQIPPLYLLEGFGMQPLEAIACGALPVANLYGGMGDYLEAPWNCRKIGVHSLEYDLAQIERAVRGHDGTNPDEERVREEYGEVRWTERFLRIEEELLFYYQHLPPGPPEAFRIEPERISPWRQPREWLYQRVVRTGKRLRGVRPR